MKRLVILFALLGMVALGCSGGDKGSTAASSPEQEEEVLGHPAIGKDLDLGEQARLKDLYVGRHAWTRGTIDDLTEREVPGEPKKKIVPRDTKVEIFDLTFSYTGAVTVIDKGTYGGNIPKRRKITHGLHIERPMTVDKVETKLAQIFWFKDPTLRQIDYIRDWGKKTARAVVNHEVFIGMPAEAALESWGIPTSIRTFDIGGNREEQWAYKETQRTKYLYIVQGKVAKQEE
ncbi:MAG: hypothetical protein O7D32_07605 [bacterium]|nr:hypothetical protein [bacterium]